MVYNSKWVRSNGNFYSSYTVIDWDGLNPIYSRVIGIYIVCSKTLLLHIQKYHCEYFDEHYHSFIRKETSQQDIIKVNGIGYNDIILHSHKLFNSSTQL